MITIALIIAVLWSVALGFIIYINFQNQKQIKEIFKEIRERPKRMLEETEPDPVLSDLMEYTFDKGLKCTIRPNQEGKASLFTYYNNKDYLVTELYTTSHKKGTTGYNVILQELKDKVDNFLENFEEFKNAKN